jgi:hypothetical protein
VAAAHPSGAETTAICYAWDPVARAAQCFLFLRPCHFADIWHPNKLRVPASIAIKTSSFGLNCPAVLLSESKGGKGVLESEAMLNGTCGLSLQFIITGIMTFLAFVVGSYQSSRKIKENEGGGVRRMGKAQGSHRISIWDSFSARLGVK